jgi:hypothetical protein
LQQLRDATHMGEDCCFALGAERERRDSNLGDAIRLAK